MNSVRFAGFHGLARRQPPPDCPVANILHVGKAKVLQMLRGSTLVRLVQHDRAKLGGRILRAVALLGSMAFTSGNPALAEQKLTGSELRDLLTGTMVQGTTDGLNDVFVTFGADGTMQGRAVALFLEQEDKGTWRVVDNTVCLTWSTWADSEENCLEVEDRGDSYESYTADGSVSSTFRVNDEGNPDTIPDRTQVAGSGQEKNDLGGAVGADR